MLDALTLPTVHRLADAGRDCSDAAATMGAVLGAFCFGIVVCAMLMRRDF